MISEYNKKLGICIPTYNRASKLSQALRNWIDFCAGLRIPIYISDNASPDGTLQVVEKFKAEYPYIFYSRNEENVGPDKNFELALNRADTEFCWLMGDDDFLEEGTIADILDILDSKHDLVLINSNRYINSTESKIYSDMNQLMFELGSTVTYMSSLIFNKRMIDSKEFYDIYNVSAVRNYHFAHLAAVFSYLAHGQHQVYFCSNIKISNIKGQEPLRWLHLIIDYFVHDLSVTINSLPDFYSEKSRIECAKRIKTHCWGIKSYKYYAVKAKAAGRFSVIRYFKYHKYIKNIFTFSERIFLFFLSLVPGFLIKAVIAIRKKFKRKRLSKENYK